jgi:hypothetical protein
MTHPGFIEGDKAKEKALLTGHKNYLKCCIFGPPASYRHLATLGKQLGLLICYN